VSFLRPLSIATLLFASACALAADKPPEAPAEQGSAQLSPLASEGLERPSVTRERPLFSPPPVVQSAARPPRPPPPPPNVALFGVVRDSDEFRAIVRTGPAAGTMRVRVGDDSVDGKLPRSNGGASSWCSTTAPPLSPCSPKAAPTAHRAPVRRPRLAARTPKVKPRRRINRRRMDPRRGHADVEEVFHCRNLVWWMLIFPIA
jgi:hypothetical protein